MKMMKVRILIMKKMNIKSKLVRVAAIASAFFIGATPLTAFAQANPETEAVEVEVLEKDVITDTEETEVEAEIPYHYTVNEDGSIVFSFNGEEYTYGAEADPTGKVVTGGSRLNVRTGAGMDYEIIDQLCPGEEVSVIGTEGDWYQIIVPAKTGYVHSDYLQVLESATNETDAALLQMFMMMFMDSMNNAGDVNYALTPDGNMNLIDDYGSATKAGKQFITLTTKSGNYFYLIIDRDDKGTETVHFLNLVDERDLLSLMEEEEVNEYLGTEEETAEPEEPVTEDKLEEPVEEEPKKEFNTSILIIFPIAGVAIIGGYIFMKKKKNQPKRPAVDPDADYTEDEDDYLADILENEDEPIEEEEE